jgi:hypothetical protein
MNTDLTDFEKWFCQSHVIHFVRILCDKEKGIVVIGSSEHS